MSCNNLKYLTVALVILSFSACNSVKDLKKQDDFKTEQLSAADSLFQKDNKEVSLDSAIVKQDWESLRSLAKKGDVATCGALAKHYVTGPATTDNHCRAFYWAQKSSESDKKYVMDVLDKYGFLVNGKPSVEVKEEIE